MEVRVSKGKRIGLGKLSDFSQTEKNIGKPVPVEGTKQVQSVKPIRPLDNKAASINIKIGSEQRDWLDSTARQIRGNNNSPVKAGDRVYPQHLIRTAIELLQNSDVDWSTVRNIHDLKNSLSL